MKIRKPSRLFTGCIIFPVFLCALCYGINTISIFLPLSDSYSKWEINRPQSYTAVVGYGTYWGMGNSSHETVRNGILLRSTTTGFSEPAIDRLFDAIRDCAFYPIGFLLCRVEYDATYGYPRRLVVEDLDLGRITEVSQFTPET